LDEKMKMIEESNLYNLVKAAKMCLVLNVAVSKDFQALEFAEYTEMQCPLTHLKAYYNKMA
jgi:hypothetical protein